MIDKMHMIEAEHALAGSPEPIDVTVEHAIFHRPLVEPWPENMQEAVFGMGCFWGVERLFWQQPGVYLTMVGYAGGFTVNPTYEQVCTGETGQVEVVRIIFDPALISYRQLLALFWENHDPTQGMRQGNDLGTQYRSVIFTNSEEQQAEALALLVSMQHELTEEGFGEITTTIEPMTTFYYAEDYHQQYLAKNPNGYCAMKGTGVVCAI